MGNSLSAHGSNDTHAVTGKQDQESQANVNAAQQVFETYELLEPILLHLPMKDLLLAQRVSKVWKETINDSKHCQRALFFAPGMAGINTSNEHQQQQPALQDIIGNPLICGEYDYTPARRIKLFRLMRPDTIKKLNGKSSCYKMLLLSPQTKATASPVVAWGSLRPPWRKRKKASLKKNATYKDALNGIQRAGIVFSGSADAVVEISVERPFAERVQVEHFAEKWDARIDPGHPLLRKDLRSWFATLFGTS